MSSGKELISTAALKRTGQIFPSEPQREQTQSDLPERTPARRMMETEGEGSMMAAEMEMETEMVEETAGEGETETEEEAAEEWRLERESECLLRNCECRWSYVPRIPRVAPGRDYSSIPAGADHRPAWSLLVGLKDGAVLRLKRLRVARSGRILGRSNDALEAFHDIKTPTGRRWFDASAALAPNGRSLCVVLQEEDRQHHALHLTLPDGDAEEEHLPLPEIQAAHSHNCMPISAGGQIWALCPIVNEYGVKLSLLMRPLHLLPIVDQVEYGGWQQVGQHKHDKDNDLWRGMGGGFLQGYAVLPGPLILVSLKQDRTFFTFTPGSGHGWTLVLTDETRPPQDYVPIIGRGVYMEQDNAIYVLHDNTIYAYKLSYVHHQEQGDDQGRLRLRLDPPITIDRVCPHDHGDGCGFLTRLDGRLMCFVWISLAPRQELEDCRCDHLHAMVTTFNLQDPAQAQGGIQIEVLHSSFRRVDMERSPYQDQKFCFVQEYEDKEDSPVLLQHQQGQEVEDLTSSSSQQHNGDQPSKMLHCCRESLKMKGFPSICLRCGINGHTACDCPLPRNKPLPAMPRYTLVGSVSMEHRVPFERRPVATTTSIHKDLFIICQAGSQLVIYQTGVMDETSLLQGGDDGKPLQPSCYVAPYVGDGDYWHFFLHSGSKIRAVSRKKEGMLEFGLNKDRTMAKDHLSVGPLPSSADTFVLFITVGGETIALTDTLKVFHQTRFSYGSLFWLQCETDQSHVLDRKVMISGYAAVNDDSFIVCDALTDSCLLFDLGAKQWRVVMPWATCAEDLPRTSPLNGRCVFVDGFIYTCRDGGLAAYQLLEKDHSVYLSEPILLPFSWLIDDCVSKDMCLDYAGKDVDSGAILFYVVHLQSGYPLPKHDVQITIVQVKRTKATPSSSKKRKPVGVAPVDCVTRFATPSSSKKNKPVGVALVDCVTRFIHHEEAVDARCCFAL